MLKPLNKFKLLGISHLTKESLSVNYQMSTIVIIIITILPKTDTMVGTGQQLEFTVWSQESKQPQGKG